MQITVPLVIDIPDDATIEQVESVVLEAGRAAMREAVRAVCARMDAEPVVCPACQGRSLHCISPMRSVSWTGHTCGG
ncbi:MAG: hypothetical protein M3439_07500 [Chloroflexota bacterium]|nr:hypothetical protein [Chloroflexota bacterium]